VEGSPALRDEIDAYFPQLAALCGRRSINTPPRNGQGTELQTEVTSFRERRSPTRRRRYPGQARVLAEQSRRELEQERTTVLSQTDQVRESQVNCPKPVGSATAGGSPPPSWSARPELVSATNVAQPMDAQDSATVVAVGPLLRYAGVRRPVRACELSTYHRGNQMG
jgi:hypothetical protein